TTDRRELALDRGLVVETMTQDAGTVGANHQPIAGSDAIELARKAPRHHGRHEALVELSGRLLPDAAIDVPQARTKQRLELVVATRVLVGTEPPEPVAAFGDVERLEGGRIRERRRAR